MVPPIPCHTIGTSTRIARDANSKVFKLSPTYTKLPCDLPFFLGKFWPWRVQATKLEAPVAKKLRLIFPFTVARSLNCIPWKCFSKQFSKHWLSIAEAKLNLQGQQHARRLDSRRLAVPCDNFHQWNHPRSSQDQASKQCEAWKHVGVLVLVIVNPAVNLSQGCIQWTCTLEMRIYTKDGNLPLLVSLLSRKGTCDLRAAKALTTFLRQTKSSSAMFQWTDIWWSRAYHLRLDQLSGKKSPWRASQRPIDCDWCWWLPEIACLLSLTSWPRPKWIKVECNAVEIHFKNVESWTNEDSLTSAKRIKSFGLVRPSDSFRACEVYNIEPWRLGDSGASHGMLVS